MNLKKNLLQNKWMKSLYNHSKIFILSSDSMWPIPSECLSAIHQFKTWLSRLPEFLLHKECILSPTIGHISFRYNVGNYKTEDNKRTPDSHDYLAVPNNHSNQKPNCKV